MSNKFGVFGLEVLDLREEDAVRSVISERYRFSKHLAGSAIALKDIADIRPRDIAELARALSRKEADDNRGSRRLSRSTIGKILQLASNVFDEAVAAGLRDDNPCTAVRALRRKESLSTQETTTALTKEEVAGIASCSALSVEARCLLLFAIGTGLRQGEQWNLHWSDLHLDSPQPHAVIRYGSQNLPPKNGKIRSVPLFGLGESAARVWADAVRQDHEANPLVYHAGLVFPTSVGTRRQSGAPPKFGEWLKTAEVTRHIRWHDLRHTCGTALIAGYWGPKWSLVDIRDMLGHSSIQSTEQYARHGDTGLKAAAASMRCE